MATVDNVTVEEEIITVHDENDGGKKTPEQISQKTQHNQNDEEDVNTKPPRLKLCCGCCSSRKKDRADPVKENMANSRNYPNASCANTLKLFLDSPVYFLFVIVSTLIISYFILAELMLDITAAPCNETTSTSSCFNGVSTVLHWFCFAVLVIYSVELCFRVGLWRLQLIKDFIAIVDCIVMLCAFVVFVTFTFMDSQTSTLDAISLIIIFRLIRILSIIKNMTINVKRECSRRNAAAEMRICHLEKQITDKTFEIRQLQLFLGDTSQINDPQIRDAIESSKARREMGAAADTELELAIAMSKQIYESQEYNDQGYLGEKPGNKLPKPDHDDFTVIVHPRPQPRESMTSDLGTANDHDEYGLFPKSLRDREDVSAQQ